MAAKNEQADFVLKHRLVGAAVLILFGVIFLPWLLSPPAQQDLESEEPLLDDNGVAPISMTLSNIDEIGQDSAQSDELLEQLEREASQLSDDEVYVSRITPLDRPTPVRAEEPSENSNQIGNENQADETDSTDTSATVEDEDAVSQKEGASEASDSASASTISTQATQPISRGWAVQVGVFTDTTGAQRVIADLRAKGFTPNTTVVDTNKGKGTGTRVWLGPYESRVEAAKAKVELSTKTGEPGFIRAYP